MQALRSQEGEHGEDAAVVVGGDVQVEAGENAVHVRLHRLGAEEQVLADGLVGAAHRHEGEHLALPLGQLLDGIAGASPADELGDHFRIDYRPTAATRRTASTTSFTSA